jgi:predicted amidohydrolase YtcJ
MRHMTHEYRILIGGTVIRGPGQADATAIAWAGGTIIAIGSDTEVRAISRGDSFVASIARLFVAAVPRSTDPSLDLAGVLEVGGDANFAILTFDPRRPPSDHGTTASIVCVVRLGRVVRGRLPGSISH